MAAIKARIPTTVRLLPELHEKLSAYAEKHERTLNFVIVDAVERLLGGADRPPSEINDARFNELRDRMQAMETVIEAMKGEIYTK